ERLERTLTSEDIQLYAVLSGDDSVQNVGAVDERAADVEGCGVIAHGMWAGALIAALIGTRLPGPGARYLGQSLKFQAPVRVGDTLTIDVTVAARDTESHRLRLACKGTNQRGETVISGEAEVVAPTSRIEYRRATLPEVRLSVGSGGLQRLLEHVRPLGAVKVAVVHPCDALSLAGALDARDAGLIEPVLVAPR